MYVKDVLVQNQVGLHARPATFFIQKANEFKSSSGLKRKREELTQRASRRSFTRHMGGTKIRSLPRPR